ncbi:hypothetical protein NFI96_031714 [Prochilodus magdalenae]|nr:hypothetical protein NFI96_031714 [Prochilodus magdalenae]
MDKVMFSDALYWWGEVSSCLHTGHSGCVSGALGFLAVLSVVMSYFMILCHSCKLRAWDTGSTIATGLYCLIGDLCNAAGAVLSQQLPLQIIMAFFMVTLDTLLLISVVLPYCWWHHSKTGRRVRTMTRRRRQNSLAVCLLFGMGGYVYLGKAAHHSQPLASTSLTSRRLLSIFLHDRIELLGYVLGLLSFVISWTSRFPFFFRASRGEMSNPLHVSSRVLRTLSGAFYASAILLYDTRLESIVRALPWILSGACCAILDFAILIVSCYRIRYKRQSVRTLDSDTVSLLGRPHRPTAGQHLPKDKPVKKHHLSSRRSSCPKMTEMGHYMDVNLQPVRKVCLKEVTITREGSADSQPLKRSVKVVRVDECYSSGSTTDSSSISSELEWDFEETPPQWSSQNGDQQNTDEFPLQERMTDQRSKCDRSSFHACFCNSGGLEERTVPASPDTNLNVQTLLND